MRKTLLALLVLTVFLSGCNFPINTEFTSTVIPISDLLINQQSKYPSTPTPFQPLFPTPTLAQLPTSADPGDTSQPGNPSDSTNDAPPQLDRPEGQVNILLLGSDWRAGSGFRTDVILLVSFNKNTGTATLLSFPRIFMSKFQVLEWKGLMPLSLMEGLNSPQQHS